METVTLIVSRRPSYVGMAVAVRVLINGMLIGQVKVGGRLQVNIPVQNCMLELDMVGNSYSFRPIRGTFPLTPSYCKKGVITVDFGVKSNALGILTSGIWQKLGDIQADIKYL